MRTDASEPLVAFISTSLINSRNSLSKNYNFIILLLNLFYQ